MSHYDVFGVGQCSLDFLAPVQSFPEADEKHEFSGLITQGGGPVATALVALSRWGLRCYFAGLVGDDGWGAEIIKSLHEAGVDTTGLVVRKGYTSQFAFVIAEKQGGRRTIFWQRPTGSPLDPEEISTEVIGNSRLVHLDGLFPDASLAAALTAKKCSLPVVVDAGSMREGMLELARETDYFIASEKFARSLVGDDPVEEACRAISALGPRLAAVTLGEKGYAALYDDIYIEKSAYAVKAIDTTGCGDVFHAGFIYGLLQKWDLERSLDFGAWAAAQVATAMGGRTGIPKVDSWPRFKDKPPQSPEQTSQNAVAGLNKQGDED